jgi:threonine/homoserine/homoserine lactone efflux protein
MDVPGFTFNPLMLFIEGSAIGFLIAGYLTGVGAALGDAVFGAVAAFGLNFVQQFVASHEAWLRGIGGLVLSVMGWMTMRHRPRTVGDPVANDRDHNVATHFHFTSSSFFITVFNPLTVMAFGAAFAGRNLGNVASSLADASLLVAGVFAGALAWWAILCTAAVALRQHFTGAGLLWLNRISGAVILGFGAIALVSLLPLPWRQIGHALGL